MTTIAVMQPYFIPYAGYFRLFVEADLVCIFDCVQFPRRGRVHRNQLPGVAGQPNWLTLPLAKGPTNLRIADLRFEEGAPQSIETRCQAFPLLRGVGHPLLDAMLTPPDDVVGYLVNLLSIACREMHIPFEIIRTTTLQIPDTFRGEDRVLEICRKFGAKRYVNLAGGQRLYNREHFARKGVELKLFEPWTGSNWSILYHLITEPAADVSAQVRA
ncbi:MAG: hypothetical protein CFH10_01780 [Alphaproteobacteria bacterium MarineAlpha4_Bin2]|nr:MAG: hypothetical protein CFH10_01780 [Alphaproteobacteria bacterium MarineAlpha4_Bin2]